MLHKFSVHLPHAPPPPSPLPPHFSDVLLPAMSPCSAGRRSWSSETTALSAEKTPRTGQTRRYHPVPPGMSTQVRAGLGVCGGVSMNVPKALAERYGLAL